MTFNPTNLFVLGDLAGALPQATWLVAGVIVVVGLLIVGLRDLLRLSPSRIWAIGGVCFRESIRRRVLWIIPLAVLGAVIVSQFQEGIDEQDILRQTTKFCLFAAGLVVVMSTIILACTNLPNEIETRVIYTIVTKPATRLELILGKIVGFARVSALILIIMGLFTYGYLCLRDWREQQLVAARLQTDSAMGAAERNKLQHYQDKGMLTAKTYLHPYRVEVMAPLDPVAAAAAAADLPASDNPQRSIYGGSEQEFMYPFTVNPQQMFAPSVEGAEPTADDGIGRSGMMIGVRMRWHRYAPDPSQMASRAGTQQPALVDVDILDPTGYNLVYAVNMFDPRYPTAKEAHTTALDLPMENQTDQAGPLGQPAILWAYVPPNQTASIFGQKGFYVHVFAVSNNVQVFADPASVFVMIAPPPLQGQYAPAIPAGATPRASQEIWPDAGPDGRPAPPIVRGRLGTRGGQQLTGTTPRDAHCPFAVLHFHGEDFSGSSADLAKALSVEFNSGIQNTSDSDEKLSSGSELTMYVRSAAGLSPPTQVNVENKQTIFATLSAPPGGKGDFDILMRCDTRGDSVQLQDASLSVIAGEEPFVWNLAKSLLILWMLTILVVAISVLCSTFLSWPIAVVLTVVLLMGHWAVTEVADTTDKTLGRSIATDMGLTDPSKAEAVANSVNALSGWLQVVGAGLPDIDRFAAIQSIERGQIVSSNDFSDALGVLAGFGIPAAVLAYLVFKRKEVAP